jgi:hypothetical protein
LETKSTIRLTAEMRAGPLPWREELGWPTDIAPALKRAGSLQISFLIGFQTSGLIKTRPSFAADEFSQAI